MKSSIQQIIILMNVILVTSAFTYAQESSAGSTTPNPQPETMVAVPSANSSVVRTTTTNRTILAQAANDERQFKLQQELQKLAERSSALGVVSTIGAASENIIMIPTQEISPENLLNINEDMNIMSRILLNKLNPQPRGTLGGWNLFADQWVYGQTLGLANNKFSSMYLQGYGALFLMTVDFPLSAPPETQEKPQEPNEEEFDQVWQQTRQQIYEPQVSSTTSTGTRTGAATISRTRATQPQTKYDAEKVDNLKTTLVTTLKHASNIRALKPDESVTLRVTGPGQSVIVVATSRQDKRIIIDYVTHGTTRKTVVTDSLPDFLKSIAAPTAIVIRAKKSDIDAFAKGELSLDKFRDTVEVFSYPLLSGNGAN